MKIEIDTEAGILIFDKVKMSLELLASLATRNGLWFRIVEREPIGDGTDNVVITSKYQ